MTTTILTIATSAGTVELYQDRRGYWITNPRGYRIGEIGSGAFHNLDYAINVASRVAASWQIYAEAAGEPDTPINANIGQ